MPDTQRLSPSPFSHAIRVAAFAPFLAFIPAVYFFELPKSRDADFAHRTIGWLFYGALAATVIGLVALVACLLFPRGSRRNPTRSRFGWAALIAASGFIAFAASGVLLVVGYMVWWALAGMAEMAGRERL